MTILSLINLINDFCSSLEHKFTFKSQKGSKEIVKIVHMFQP